MRKLSIGEAKKSVNFTKKSVVESLDFELIHYQKNSIEAFSEKQYGRDLLTRMVIDRCRP